MLYWLDIDLVEWYMCGSTYTQRHMVLGGILVVRQVSMMVLWWLALASIISDAFKFFCLSSRKVWFACFGFRLMDVCFSSNSLSISLVPSMDLFKIPLRFSAHADPGI